MAEKGEEYISKRERPKEYEEKERTIMKPSDFIDNLEKRQLEAEKCARAIMEPFKKRQFGTEERTNILNALLKEIKDVLINSFPEIEEKQYEWISSIRVRVDNISRNHLRKSIEDEIMKKEKELYEAGRSIGVMESGEESGDLTMEKVLKLLTGISKGIYALDKRVTRYTQFGKTKRKEKKDEHNE